MKNLIIKISAAAAVFAGIPAVAMAQDVAVSNLKVEKAESTLLVSMDLDASALKMKSNNEIICTPFISFDDSIRRLTPVIFAGRNSYIQDERRNVEAQGNILSRSNKSVSYSVTVPYSDWMQTAELKINEDPCGCGFSKGESKQFHIGDFDFVPRVFEPVFVMVTPPAELEKTRKVSGSAYIDFPVNKTEIYPDYRRNPEELASIRSTIDVVAKDPDTKITSIRIEGFASPEGPYANNERLAKGRALSLAEYVRSLYSLDKGVMKTSSVAENWQGLRRYVSHSSLPDTTALLAVIDNTSLAPDLREARLKKQFPKEYEFLLKEVYPGLRRSDYEINYIVRTFTSVEEIKEIMATAPGKLSVNEIYVVANSLDPESVEYREAFELAVRLFPDNEAANLNMAAIALERDELEIAEKYLSKAGSSPRAVYARGVYEAKRGNYEAAKPLLEAAENAGITEASDAIFQLKRMKKF